MIVKNYTIGQEISVEIDITANHDGYFEFRLCQNDEPMKQVKQDCFDKNLLEVVNINNIELIQWDKASVLDESTNKYKYFVPFMNRSQFIVNLKLPNKLKCKQCILQWRYHTGNNYGLSDDKRLACLGCSNRQEEFYNCADIAILSSSSSSIGNNKNKTSTTTTTNKFLTKIIANPKLQNINNSQIHSIKNNSHQILSSNQLKLIIIIIIIICLNNF
jgi:hypothetical protein